MKKLYDTDFGALPPDIRPTFRRGTRSCLAEVWALGPHRVLVSVIPLDEGLVRILCHLWTRNGWVCIRDGDQEFASSPGYMPVISKEIARPWLDEAVGIAVMFLDGMADH